MEWKDKKIGVRLVSLGAAGFIHLITFNIYYDKNLVSPLHETSSCALFFSLSLCTLPLGGSAQALERQKEYTDAIRIERDELREEVVKLKDVLKVLSQCVDAYFSCDSYNTNHTPS